MPKFMMRRLRKAMPLLAVMVADDDNDGGGNEPVAEPGAEAGNDPGDEGGKDDDGGDKGFPENTPLSDMTDVQKAAYWRHESKKQERIATEERSAKAKLQADLDEAKRQTLSDEERALADAKAQGRGEATAEARAEQLPMIALYELRLRGMSAEEAGEVVEVLDLSKLAREDGSLDSDRLDSLVQRTGARSPGGSRGREQGYPPTGNKKQVVPTREAQSKRAEEILNKK